MQHIEAVFQGQGEISQTELASLKAWDIQILTSKGKHLTSIELICGQRNLRWLDLRDNQINDSELRHLQWLKKLQVLLLDNNQITNAQALVNISKQNKDLKILSLVGNPLVGEIQKFQKLKSDLKGIQVLSKQYDQDIIILRRKCLLLQIKADQKDNELKQLKKQLFEDKSKPSIDLGRYLINLKIYSSDYGQLIHTLFLTLLNLSKQDSRIKEIYPNLPWNIIQQWPQNNFILHHKIDYSQIQHILDHQSIQYSTSLDIVLQNILNQYYTLELSSLFKQCKLLLTYSNLNKLLCFLLFNCKNYFLRKSENYQSWVAVSFPNPIEIKQNLLKYLLEGGVERIIILQGIINKDKDRKLTQEQTTFLNEIKKMTLIIIFKSTNKQSNHKSFSNMILEFFENLLSLYSTVDHILSKSKQQNQLFARFLFLQFDSSDYYYLSLLQREGQIRNQEYFIRNVNKLSDIVSLKKWLDSIENIESKLKTIDSKQLNSSLTVFFKKVLGRPQFNLSLIKKYFHRFDFQIIQGFIDSHQRKPIIQILSSKFGNDFSFIRASIISRKTNQKLVEMNKLLAQNRILSRDQQQFVKKSTYLFSKVQERITINPLIESIVYNYPSSFSLLQNILQTIPTVVQIDQIIDANTNQKLYTLENIYLLDLLRSIIEVNKKQIKLVNRSKSWFAKHLQSLKDVKFYLKHQYIFNFIKFSHTLYLQNSNENPQGIPHKNQINPDDILKTNNIKIYLEKVNNNYILSDYLLGICQKQIRELIFDVSQGVLTFDMLKFRELSKDPACKYCFDEDFYEQLQLIANTNGFYFIEIQKYQKSRFNDKKLRQQLLEAYHEQLLLHCLKRQLMNLGQYSKNLQKAEKLAKVKGFQLRLPLFEISKVVRTQAFQKSQFKTELFKYLKTKARNEVDRKNILVLFAQLNKKIVSDDILDKKKIEFVKQMFVFEQNKMCETLIKNISLISSIDQKSKIYPIFDWTLLDSFAKNNYLTCWQQNGIEQIQQRLTKYRRILSRYLSNPQGFKGQKQALNRGADKLQDLILNQQINAMLSQIPVMNGINKKGASLVLHRIHKCFQLLCQKSKVDCLYGFNYQLCLSIKKKLGHSGFLILTDYLVNGQSPENREDIQQIIDNIIYKIQYYKSLDTLKLILIERQYNPANYFKALMNSLIILSNINTLNTQIQTQFIKNRYPLFPWRFIVMASALNTEGMWYRILMTLQQQFGLYLQLLHYLDTRDETQGITILSKLFQTIYSNECCNDLIKRINSILPLSEQLKTIINKLLYFKNYRIQPQITDSKIVDLISKQQSKSYEILKPDQLLSCLRVLSLKGEYINRIEKMSNKLRNMLCDYDQTGLNIEDFLKTHSTQQSQKDLKNSLLQILSISLNYKDSLFNSSYKNFHNQKIKSCILDKDNSKLIIDYLNTLNYKKQFACANFTEPDLHLKFIILTEPHEVKKYFKNLLVLYKSLVKDIDITRFNQWQQAQFLIIAIFTTIRLKNKYRMVTEQFPDVESEFNKQPYRIFRNHLAHYVPSQKTLAAKKLNVNSLQQMNSLYKRINKLIQNIKV